MVSHSTYTSGADNEPWRVLVVASDPESTSEDLIELEAQVARESLSNGLNGTSVNAIATLHRKEFVGALNSFQPNVVHFTRRGSVEQNIRMLDPNGWIRQITGRTIAHLFHEAECRIPILLLMNCSILREQWYVSEFSEYLLTFKSKEATHQLPINLIQGIYSALGKRFESEGTLNAVFAYVAENPSMQGIDFQSFGGEVPRQISDLGRQYFELWRMPQPVMDWIPKPIVARMPTASAEQTIGATGREEDGSRKYRVWFGTNRQEERRNGRVSFGPARADRITYGYCDVTIPKYHRIGSVGDPWWKRFPRFWQNNRLTMADLQLLAETAFFSQVRRLFADLPDDERILLVFLHGFNTSFDRAAIRAAQLGVDLGILGATAFFGWPSRGSVAEYPADIASMEASEKYISQFLLEMSERSGAHGIHLIAHSIGNRGLLRAFDSLAQQTRARIGKNLKQVFLAAPDIDEDLFRDLSDVYRSMAMRTTMYVSSKDLALNSSGIIHDHPRAGYTPPVTVVEGVDTVEVSNIDLTFLGHGYVASARPVLADMHNVMASDAAPKRRFGLQLAFTDDGEEYWRIRS